MPIMGKYGITVTQNLPFLNRQMLYISLNLLYSELGHTPCPLSFIGKCVQPFQTNWRKIRCNWFTKPVSIFYRQILYLLPEIGRCVCVCVCVSTMTWCFSVYYIYCLYYHVMHIYSYLHKLFMPFYKPSPLQCKYLAIYVLRLSPAQCSLAVQNRGLKHHSFNFLQDIQWTMAASLSFVLILLYLVFNDIPYTCMLLHTMFMY